MQRACYCSPLIGTGGRGPVCNTTLGIRIFTGIEDTGLKNNVFVFLRHMKGWIRIFTGIEDTGL